MEDMVDKKNELKKGRKHDPGRGVVLTWDNAGNAFVSMPVNNIPLKQFDDWMRFCKANYSGKRWDMILADRLKAQAYDVLLASAPQEEAPPEEDKEDKNPDGLLNGG